MGRLESVARSIVLAVLNGDAREPRSLLGRILALFAAFFALYQLPLRLLERHVFQKLRSESWKTEDEDYLNSFHNADAKKPREPLQSKGDMGFSGSTFFSTSDQRYLIKSVPRYFEHSFFRDDLLVPYADHMASHPKSALVRICDFLAGPYFAMGSLLGLAPTHHIVMENILYGQSEAKSRGSADWETWDLKPVSYFFPERDIAGGRLTSDATKDKLADKFDDKMILTQQQADELVDILGQDTRLLAEANAVDYSLFLVRIAKEEEESSGSDLSSLTPDTAPFVPPSPPSWRTGVDSPDGKHTFRAVILDFFWAKHKTQPKLMTGLINLYNILDKQGPMSITTDPEEYRTRFLEMVKEMIEVQG